MAKTVCIVGTSISTTHTMPPTPANTPSGAGPSGLVAAKTLLHNAVPDEFKVTVFDAQDAIGGLWPVSKGDNGRQVHPLMTANQSRHTVQFSELAWDDAAPQLPPAWMIGKYLERYAERFLTGNQGFELRLSTRVTRAERLGGGASSGWSVTAEGETRSFDYLLVASGFFGKPIIPECLEGDFSVPVVHSSRYRDLHGLLGKGRSGGGRILVVGGQMSGVEIAGTIGAHLSSEVNSPGGSDIKDIDKYKVHHVIQRPVWVFPLFTSPKASSRVPGTDF